MQSRTRFMNDNPKEREHLSALLATYASLNSDYSQLNTNGIQFGSSIGKEKKMRLDYIWREIEKRLT